MALEDGVCLGHMVEKHSGDIHAGLTAYNRFRAVRTARIQLGSRLIGEYIYHPAGAKADVRDQALSSKTPEQHYDQLQWLYGGMGLEGA